MVDVGEPVIAPAHPGRCKGVLLPTEFLSGFCRKFLHVAIEIVGIPPGKKQVSDFVLLHIHGFGEKSARGHVAEMGATGDVRKKHPGDVRRGGGDAILFEPGFSRPQFSREKAEEIWIIRSAQGKQPRDPALFFGDDEIGMTAERRRKANPHRPQIEQV